jgi:L-alanine-DL-glutamate epimerase-like enolase superfamily enzyme
MPTTIAAIRATPVTVPLEAPLRIEDIANDYFEDPVWGMPQLARLKEFVSIPVATNTVIVNFEQLAANVEMRAVDVVLLDTTFWGGIRPCIKAAGVCETMGVGVAVHSSGELGGYPYDRDPGRPGWYPLIPNRDWADPAATGVPELRR